MDHEVALPSGPQDWKVYENEQQGHKYYGEIYIGSPSRPEVKAVRATKWFQKHSALVQKKNRAPGPGDSSLPEATESGSQATGSGPAGVAAAAGASPGEAQPKSPAQQAAPQEKAPAVKAAEVVAQAPATKAAAKAPASAHADLPPAKVQKTGGQKVAMPK
ncbi:unnamed protein product [Polarella glacialis]|uniref:Uncharacterized protein n=1 Tax=Polarella glacialis TaxID=89957 RepID=A0A813FLR6_POLGL|nr:unnamed protein product [Polarella glacialis]